MIVAHLPAGYIVSTLLFHRFKKYGVPRSVFLRAGLLGSIAPDLDMIYFYGFDHRAHPHHSYFSHFPSVWLLLLTLAILCFQHCRQKKLPLLALIFTCNGMLHMLLDYIASNIYWLAPFVNRPFALITVPSVYQDWWLNFLLHRSFALEILIVLWAAYLWRKQCMARSS
ncbi:membrane protein [Methylomonas albis]|uniref:Metal-dependent hydrolase n=1 Tax=Methylomonas albis TaxID=1854563 RepID=A0ABR9CZJ5_9GAMM|nr:metal-dependent hydrolase [Methylomonas albis]MBD9356300.1 metal-dependent hydrolase [Methylomonas albis]CAD6879376.1 membrane protein [Methylomonas albis]